MTNPKNQNAEACEYLYDKMAANYDAIAGKDTYQVPKWLKQQLLPYKERRPSILDCACASGNLATMLKQIPLVPSLLYGIDISPEMVLAAKATGAYTSVSQADLSDGLQSLQGNLFEIAVSNGCLEFIENPARYLSSLKAALVPSGILLCTFEYAEKADSAVKITVDGRSLVRFARTETTVRSLLEKAGFAIEELISGPGYVSPSSGIAVPYWFCCAKN